MSFRSGINWLRCRNVTGTRDIGISSDLSLREYARSIAGSGQFVLNGNVFSGTSFFEPPNQFTFIRIENLNHSTEFPATRVQDLAPLTMLEADWDSIQLNSSQMTELLNGNWLINIGSIGVPEGEIRGQLQLVPKPSVW